MRSRGLLHRPHDLAGDGAGLAHDGRRVARHHDLLSRRSSHPSRCTATCVLFFVRSRSPLSPARAGFVDVADGDDTRRTRLVWQAALPMSEPRSSSRTPADLRQHTRVSLSIPKIRRSTGGSLARERGEPLHPRGMATAGAGLLSTAAVALELHPWPRGRQSHSLARTRAGAVTSRPAERACC